VFLIFLLPLTFHPDEIQIGCGGDAGAGDGLHQLHVAVPPLLGNDLYGLFPTLWHLDPTKAHA